MDLMSLSTIFQSSQVSVFGCDRELNTQFNSTDLTHCSIKSQTLYLIASQSHYTQYTVTEATSPSSRTTPKI